jgi:hypothetical protein
MPAVYAAAAEAARMTATRDYFANGTLELLSAADVLLVSFGLSPTGGSVAGSVWTLEFDASPVAAVAGGTAAKAQLKTAGGLAHLTGLTVTATGGGGDVTLDNTSIATGQSVAINSATITHS